MAYRIRTLTPDEAPAFIPLTFPAYAPRLIRGGLAVGAYQGREPVGLALLAPGGERRAELLSLYVTLGHRNRNLGRTILGLAEDAAAQRGAMGMHTVWSQGLASARAFESVLAARGWSEPVQRMLTLHGDMDSEFGEGVRRMYPKYESPDCLPRRYGFSTWRDMGEEDRWFIRSREGRPGWYEPRANPFREEACLDQDMSLVLRKDGLIVGWLTIHRTLPGTLRYTDVFLREDLKRAGAVAITLVTHAFWRQLAEGTPLLTMAVEKDNAGLVQMYQKRLAVGAKVNWTLGSSKSFV